MRERLMSGIGNRQGERPVGKLYQVFGMQADLWSLGAMVLGVIILVFYVISLIG